MIAFAFEHAESGDLFVQKADASTIGNVLWHETRHLYQWSQIEKRHNNKPLSDDDLVIDKWEYELLHYIPNTPETEDRHMKQDMEIDAYSFAVFMLCHYFRRPNGDVNVGLYSGTADEIWNRAVEAFEKNKKVFYRTRSYES